MNDSDLLAESLERLLRERALIATAQHDQAGVVQPALWDALVEGGFPWVSVPEAAGGVGGTVADACTVIRTTARHGVRGPIAETGLLGGWLLASGGLTVPDSLVTVALQNPKEPLTVRLSSTGVVVDGSLARVPWIERAGELLVVTNVDGVTSVLRLPTVQLEVVPGTNLAGESRGTVFVRSVELPSSAVAALPDGIDESALFLRGALARAVAMAGAMEAASELTLRYSLEREQFGQPISRFQAVQHHLVRMASEAAAASMAAALAVDGYERCDVEFTVAAAKIVAGSAAGVVSASAHQVHGAIGMTMEYVLQRHTRALWAWRQEFGSEGYWSERLGRSIAASGPDAIWDRITTGAVAS
jgi:acyl-CoA dehydrogenase